MPIATFQSGPVNSLRGAALLTGLQHAAVVDVGGTTTDVGVLDGGLPRPAPRAVRIAGASTNFAMPDVLSLGLGGGSIVTFAAASVGPAACTVGPASVGARLPQEALCLGGSVCTASDVAVRLGRMQLGSSEAAAEKLTQEEAEAAWAVMQQKLEACLDAVKTTAGVSRQQG
jgi:N-methylhydantoinase A/oxoprolinase/acetone carboxylase beta subunit